MQNEDEKIDILNGSLELWTENNKANEKRLQIAFRKGLTVSEAVSLTRINIEGVHSVHSNAGRLDWLHTLISVAADIDDNKSIFHLATSSSPPQGLFIHVIGPVLISNNIPNISFSEANEDDDGDALTTWSGPVIPIRFCHITPNLSQRAKMDLASTFSSKDEITTLTIREDTFQIALNELQSTSQQKLQPSCLQGFQSNQFLSQNGLFNISFLYVKRNKEIAPIKDVLNCNNIGCIVQAEKMKKCIKCFTPYCSRECQVAHWPLHKRVCKLRQQGIDETADKDNNSNADKSNEISETRPYIMISSKLDVGPDGEEMFHGGISSCGGIAVPKQSSSKSKKFPFRSYEFIVKVQGTPTGASVMIYDEKRIVHASTMSPDINQTVHQFTSRFREPYPRVSIHPGNMKIFLYARVVQGDLRLFLDKVAPWQNW